MPAISKMARAAPPAMTPVPGAAGFRMIRPAPAWPNTGMDDRRARERTTSNMFLPRLFDPFLDG